MQTRRLGWAGLWGIAGVVALLGQAIWRLAPLALDSIARGWTPVETAVAVVWIAIAAYAEGYRGFQRQFSPRVVARACHLTAHPRPLFVAIAPLYCMGLVHATRRRLVTSWTLTASITALVLLVRYLGRWRGIVDAGVVIGLGWGVVAILYYVGVVMAGRPLAVSPEVPAGTAEPPTRAADSA